MIAETLLLLLCAQLGLAQIHIPMDRHTSSAQPLTGSASLSSEPASEAQDLAGINLGQVGSNADELEVVLTDRKQWFSINVSFGTSPEARTYTLLLDSGSQDLWVMEAGCTSQSCNWDEALGAPPGYTLGPSGVNTSIPWKTEYAGSEFLHAHKPNGGRGRFSSSSFTPS